MMTRRALSSNGTRQPPGRNLIRAAKGRNTRLARTRPVCVPFRIQPAKRRDGPWVCARSSASWHYSARPPGQALVQMHEGQQRRGPNRGAADRPCNAGDAERRQGEHRSGGRIGIDEEQLVEHQDGHYVLDEEVVVLRQGAQEGREAGLDRGGCVAGRPDKVMVHRFSGVDTGHSKVG